MPESRTHPVHGVGEALALLERLPGGAELLRAARRRGDVALVGGALRDLLLEHWPRELDVTVASDAGGLAHELAASISPSERAYGRAVEPVIHQRFGTASVSWSYGRIDIAQRRAETYAEPGALPEIQPGTVWEDLGRRDFTVNAMTAPLAGPERGELLAVEHALADLGAGLLRVLHDLSFIDDPTRLLRLARYAARLGFEIEPRTYELARAAVASGALQTVSGGRIGTELWLAAREESGPAALRILGELGALSALGMTSRFDEELAQAALVLLPEDGRREVLLLGVALGRGDSDVLHALESTREEAEAVGAATAGRGLADQLLRAERPAAAYWALDGATPEAVAIAGALAARESEEARALARDWLQSRRRVTLDIDGSDLLAAGVSEGPTIGPALKLTLSRKRAGEIAGREEELRAALEAIEDGTWIAT